MTKSEHGEATLSALPDIDYFTKDTNLNPYDIVIHNRDCRGCTSCLVLCEANNITGSRQNSRLQLEYVAMEFFMDTEVTTVRNRWLKNCPRVNGASFCRQSDSHQEFIFREYLHDNYPDVVLLFSSSHDKTRHDLAMIVQNIYNLKSLIKQFLPATTRVFWFSSIGENLDKKPSSWRRARFDGNFTMDEQIQRINKALFNVLLPELRQDHSTISTFFDLFAMSREVLHWSQDGVHLINTWYDTVISNWLQMLCADYLL
ncbi:hypothetical protein NP493_215g00022 [Ridgeia piscesae]|uniref:Uncharacterized protein n=1 Tax=Ridgeia piscesae TaxID=27915 RepID=A0AAD9P0W9_RIDPI|nr:hypothetical protein NP493_215g00022 [Ridgeia piscesae]